MSHDGTMGKPGRRVLAPNPVIVAETRSSGCSLIPSRMTTQYAWRDRRVCPPMLTPAFRASDRVPRFSRFRWADSVRFVRFNMTRPSHPPIRGGFEK